MKVQWQGRLERRKHLVQSRSSNVSMNFRKNLKGIILRDIIFWFTGNGIRDRIEEINKLQNQLIGLTEISAFNQLRKIILIEASGHECYKWAQYRKQEVDYVVVAWGQSLVKAKQERINREWISFIVQLRPGVSRDVECFFCSHAAVLVPFAPKLPCRNSVRWWDS